MKNGSDFLSSKVSCQHKMRLVLSAFWVFAFSGCAVGPDFKSPEAPQTKQYTQTSLLKETASSTISLGEAQRFVDGDLVKESWWHCFGSDALNQLIEEALKSSPTLASASANVRQAQELLAAYSGSSDYPQAELLLGAQRQKTSPSTQGLSGESRQYNLYTTGANVHYNLDFFGGNKRALESLAARVDYRRFEYEATRLNLIANITTAAITRARLFEQEEALNATVLLQEKQLEITRDRIRFGQASQDEMLNLQAQVEQARSEAIMLRKQRGEIEHLLAMLSGHTSSEVQIHAFRLSDFTLPTDLPLVVPSQLVRQRPDIQASEALLHVANADYGVAISKLYPQINLSANLSAQALSSGTLFSGSSTVWNVIGQITQPLFNPGLPAEKRAALAVFDAATANYKNVVVEAFRNVADTLNAIENDAKNLRALTIANNATQTSLKSIKRQYHLGSASYLQLLVAEQQARQIEIGTIAAQAQRLMDSVLLYQATGGGF